MEKRRKRVLVLLAAAAVWGSSIYAVADTKNVNPVKNLQEENTQEVSTQEVSTQKDSTQTEDTQIEPDTPAGEETDDTAGEEGVSYYLNMKMNENLLKIYEEMESLMKEKELLCQTMFEEGETTRLYADQVRTQRAGIQAKKQICTNEMAFDQYFLEEKDLHYTGIQVTDDKSLGTIESCTAEYPELDQFLAASCVTNCENARANIQALQAELAYMEDVYQTNLLLQEEGDISRMDVIDSRLSVLEARSRLQSLYYDMNVAYYTVIYGARE